MILKGNMLKLTIPFFWAVQSIWLLSFKSIETFIAAIILLLISFLGIVIKSNTYNIIFLGICFLSSLIIIIYCNKFKIKCRRIILFYNIFKYIFW